MIVEIIILGILGLISGLGLEIVSLKFATEEDERTEAIEDVLPGLNCGACGYAGCEQYAKGLIDDPSELGSCVQLSDEQREEIKKILESESEE